MPSLRDIRNRIGSVKNTRQITRAMKLVSGAKLNRATQAATAAKPYSQTLTRVLTRVVAAAGEVSHPLLSTPEYTSDVVVVLLTADRGLCGNFNNLICRATVEKIDALKAEGKNVRIYSFGKKGRAYFEKRGYNVAEATTDITPPQYSKLADEICAKLSAEFTGGKAAKVYLAYNEYHSVLSQKPAFDQLLPMTLPVESGAEASQEYAYEPSGPALLGHLLPLSLRTRIFQAFLETQAGEQAARMAAMDSATRNAGELINKLTLEYNRARQAAITKELIEIISGAEAL